MEHLRQIEEDLRNISAEAKKKYPEVVEASDRALECLKSLRERYVSQIRKHTAEGTSQPPKLPQSADILAPYLLACNYADGPLRVLTVALHSIRTLATYDLIPPDELKNILRVLHIQVSSPKLEVQLKVLQVLLQITNSLSKDMELSSVPGVDDSWQERFHHINESTLFSFLSLALHLCGSQASNVSVSSTAEGTATQIVNVIMDAAKAQFSSRRAASGDTAQRTDEWLVTAEQASSKFSLTAMMLVRDLCALADGKPPTAIKGIMVPQSTALRLLHDIMSNYEDMLKRVSFLRSLLQDTVSPALISQLKHLHANYVQLAMQEGAAAATAYATWVATCTQCLLSRYGSDEMLDDMETVIALLVQSLQPDSTGYTNSAESRFVAAAKAGKLHASSASKAGFQEGDSSLFAAPTPTLKSRWEEASSIIMQGGAGAFLRGITSNTQHAVGGAGPSAGTSMAGTGSHRSSSAVNIGNSNTVGQIQAAGFYIYMAIGGPAGRFPQSLAHPHAVKYSAGGGGGGGGFHPGALTLLPSFPAAYCLDALIAFLCSDLRYLLRSRSTSDAHAEPNRGLRLLESVLINVFVGVAQFLQSSVMLEANMR